jgi:hypothetical protein
VLLDVLVGVALAGSVFLVAAVRARVEATREAGAFRCRVSPRPWARRRGRARWSRFATHARWVNDVLLVRSGFLRLGVTALAAHVAPRTQLEQLAPAEARRLGRAPRALRLVLDGGGTLEVATSEDCGELLVGPYLVAALGDPPPPREDSDR